MTPTFSSVEIRKLRSRSRTQKSRRATRRHAPRSALLTTPPRGTARPSVGRTAPKDTTSPAPRARSSTRWGSIEVARSSTTASPSTRAAVTPGTTSHQASSAPRTSTRHRFRSREACSASIVPRAAICPWSISTTSSQSRSTSSSWWLEKTTATPSSRASRCRTFASTSTPTGSSPENGSSSTSSSGSWTSAAASCTRCWLPSDSDSIRSRRVPDHLERRQQPLGPRARPVLLHAAQAGEVDELFEHAHLRIQPAFLRHVPEPAANGGVDRIPAPAHLAGVGLEHPERDPHRGGLAGAVAPHEPDDAPRRNLERHAVERDDVAEAAAQIDQLEHVGQG